VAEQVFAEKKKAREYKKVLRQENAAYMSGGKSGYVRVKLKVSSGTLTSSVTQISKYFLLRVCLIALLFFSQQGTQAKWLFFLVVKATPYIGIVSKKFIEAF
jgi:hypothetical protein